MICGRISLNSRTNIEIIDGIMDAEYYRGILLRQLMPFASEKMPKNWIFQQDNDPKYTSRLLKQFFVEEKICLLPWPSCSPDLNPIENVWAILKRNIEKRNPENLENLKAIIVEEWQNLDQQIIFNCIMSMTSRVQSLIERKGKKINY